MTNENIKSQSWLNIAQMQSSIQGGWVTGEDKLNVWYFYSPHILNTVRKQSIFHHKVKESALFSQLNLATRGFWIEMSRKLQNIFQFWKVLFHVRKRTKTFQGFLFIYFLKVREKLTHPTMPKLLTIFRGMYLP